jgi:WD40 repeat protein
VQVKSIAWKTGDRRLVTCSVDGSVILWNVLKGVKVRYLHIIANAAKEVYWGIDVATLKLLHALAISASGLM